MQHNDSIDGTIYLLRNTVNGKVYIGKTTLGIRQRWKGHQKDAKRITTRTITRAIRKYGPDAFRIEILAEHVPDHDTLNVPCKRDSEMLDCRTKGAVLS